MLELDEVTAGYGMTRVLRDVSLSVPDGKVCALLGANGAGKTTLLRVAARLLPVESGSLELDGQDVTSIRAQDLVRRGVCYIPDGQGIFKSLTVRDNLHLFLREGSKSEAVDRAAAVFPVLGQRLSQIAGTMSGGEQQMLSLMRAQLSGAKVALLDEVSMGLAPKIVDQLFDALHVMAGAGLSLLLVEQYVQRALEMADVVYLLSRGSITYSGPPDALDAAELMRSYVGVDTANSG